MTDDVACYSEASVSVKFFTSSMTMISLSTSIICHITLSPAVIAQALYFSSEKNSSILRIDCNCVTIVGS